VLQVKVWLTFSNPLVLAWMGYEAGWMAPGVSQEDGYYRALHNILLSHVAAYKRYGHYRHQQHGQFT
jgi:beta-glucosidase/6-phospho-beta-glucosidase/beta-galactosidase